MPVFNRLKEFLDSRPDPMTGNGSTSAYRFWKDTDLSRTTAYRLYNDSTYIPTGDVLDKICSTYRIKPGVILDWEPDEELTPYSIKTKSGQKDNSEAPSEVSSQTPAEESSYFSRFLPVPRSA
jgi:hypothetical protein